MKAVRDRWISSVPSDFTDPQTCSGFFDHSYRSLKEYLGYYLETPTMGLTAEEMRREMERLGSVPELTDRVAQVMETCETTRYMNNGVSSDHVDAARSLADDIREILTSRE